MRVTRAFLSSALTQMALGYYCAFPMVGSNFLLPGRHTYSIVCLLLLLLSVMAALSLLARVSTATAASAAAGFCSALVAGVGIFNASSSALRDDYFIFGLPLATAISIACVALAYRTAAWMEYAAAAKTGVRILMFLGIALLVYAVANFLKADADYQRYLRLQLYILPVVATFAHVILKRLNFAKMRF